MALEGTVKVPAVGPVKKTWVVAGLGVLGIILGIAYWRHAHAAPAAPAAAPKAADGTAAFDSGFNSGFGGGTVTTVSGPAPTVFSDNAQWYQAALAYLEGIGSNPITVADALGKYLHGDIVTRAQQTVIESAIGAEGLPPASGPGGFPPNIRVRKPGPPPPPQKVKVPNVAGRQWSAASSAIEAAGLKAAEVPRGGKGIVAYEVPGAGTEVSKGSTVTLHMAATG